MRSPPERTPTFFCWSAPEKLNQEHKEGKTVSEISREYGIAEQTFYKWQQKYGNMKVSEVKKMKSLEEENARLKRLVAELSLEKMVMSDVIKNFSSPD